MSAPALLNSALVGRYVIEREVGRGGMATVYVARDVKHNRKVALKVLNPELGAVLGVERFLAEIQVTANLQHPNLLPLFDSGEAEGLLYYVMPFVEGESLRAKLEREKQLPVNEAIAIAVAIAGALDYAHRQGVIHRDLKPENILLQDGQPLIADFGIALAVSNAGGNRITQTGISLGTPQYMSPEQATGDRVIDGRTDIYSLGAMLYELLVGDPPYLGGTSQAVIAKVLTDKPRGVRASRAAVPAHVEATVERALEKLPADRFATAREFADALQGRLAVESTTSLTSTPLARRRRRAMLAAGVGVVVAAVALGAFAGAKLLAPSSPLQIPVRFSIATGSPTPLMGLSGAALDISSDGSTIAFVDIVSRRIHVRRLNELAVRQLEGTERAQFPVFSPDGRWIAFLSPTGVKKVSMDGAGAPQLVTRTFAEGLAWPTADRMLAMSRGDLLWIESNGGNVTPVAKLDRAKVGTIQWARMLPDGKAILFVAYGPSGQSTLGVVNADGSDIQLLDFRLSNVLGMVDDYLIYLRDRSIMAVRFDARRRRVLGAPVLVVENVVMGAFGSMRAALSESGTLVYQLGAEQMQLQLVSSGGTVEPLPVQARTFYFPRFSPDGRKIALTVANSGQDDVWIYDSQSRTLQRLTRDGGDRPEWTPDGRRVIYRRDAGGGEQIWWQPADGSGPAQPLQTSPRVVPEGLVSPDGKYLVYRVNSDTTGRDLWYRAMSGDTTPHVLAATMEEELMPRLSPDGRWLAYVSTTSGVRDVYVQPFPGPGAVVQMSAGGGDEPLWSRDGRRLYYRSSLDFVSATVASDGGQLRVTSRAKVLEGLYPSGSVHASWDIAPDGRFLVLKPMGESADIIVIHNWRTEFLSRMKQGR
jgi:eukaryotic-like serine/threonine-protein kinase